METETQQIADSTDEQLLDRLRALRERYDPKDNGGGYPMAQLREFHLIKDELLKRSRSALSASGDAR